MTTKFKNKSINFEIGTDSKPRHIYASYEYISSDCAVFEILINGQLFESTSVNGELHQVTKAELKQLCLEYFLNLAFEHKYQ